MGQSTHKCECKKVVREPVVVLVSSISDTAPYQADWKLTAMGKGSTSTTLVQYPLP